MNKYNHLFFLEGAGTPFFFVLLKCFSSSGLCMFMAAPIRGCGFESGGRICG